MTLQVIGAGVGRTGTHSLKLALEQLGLGPAHHMEEVLKDPPRLVPLWHKAAEGEHDWSQLYDGYQSAVDWPTASFWQELLAANPGAKVILSNRSAESWYESFSETILKLLQGADQAPPHMRPFLAMGDAVLGKAGFRKDMGRDELLTAYRRHSDKVTAEVPKDQLLIIDLKQGWGPLCDFLGKAVPDAPFPASNTRADFWERLKPPQ